MLHQGILPYHRRWATFLMRLRLVVVDELHSLRGIFGSNVAHVLRRLQRVCAHYGSSPSFCFASATIGNPAELAHALCGQPVTAIDDDGSPQSERCFGLWQRPLLDEHTGPSFGCRTRRPPSCSPRFVRGGPADARVHPEPPRRGARRRARPSAGCRRTTRRWPIGSRRTAPATCPRSGASSNAGSATGACSGIAATNALELGIDVGGLDAVVLNGFPGTLASMRQQAGRAGRTGRRAAAVLVAGDDQLDQWYAAHPERAVRAHRRGRGRQPLEPVRAAAPGRVRRARAPARTERRSVVRARSRRRGARARPGRAAQAPRRAHVLGRPRTAGAPRRSAHRFVGRVPPGRPGRRRRRAAHRHGGLEPGVPRRAPGRALPAPGPAVARRAARPRRSRRLARTGRRRRRVHADPRGHRHRHHRARTSACHAAPDGHTSARST